MQYHSQRKKNLFTKLFSYILNCFIFQDCETKVILINSCIGLYIRSCFFLYCYPYSYRSSNWSLFLALKGDNGKKRKGMFTNIIFDVSTFSKQNTMTNIYFRFGFGLMNAINISKAKYSFCICICMS